jgi:hypothetical protein
MDSMRSVQSTGSGAAVRTALAPAADTRRTITPARTPVQKVIAPSVKPVGYGLPCAKCRKYYAAGLSACPICKSSERVSPIAAIPCPPAAETPAEGAVLDEERERFLREFKAKLYEAHTQIKSTPNQPCAHAGEGGGAHESATVCETCYARLQARVDLLEAALHMDLKEAAQVIYDAVWSDTSDSNKTYQNAARALLGELRRRAGMKLVLGRMQPLAH